MPLKLRRKVGESFDASDTETGLSIRICVDDADRRQRRVELMAIPLQGGIETEDFQMYRIPLGETFTIEGLCVKPYHITEGGTVYLYITAPQHIRLYRTELLQRSET